MNCPNCNNVIQDDSRFCNECGYDILNMRSNNSGDNLSVPETKVHGSKRKFKIIIGGVCIGVLAIGIGLFLLFQYLYPYREPLNKITRALNAKASNPIAFEGYFKPSDYELLVNLEKLFKDTDYYDEYLDGVEDYYEDLYERIEDEYGEKARFSIQWGDAKRLSERRLKEYQNDYEKPEDYDDIIERMNDVIDAYAEWLGEQKHGADLSNKQIEEMKSLFKDYLDGNLTEQVTDGYEVDLVINVKGNDDEDRWKLRNAIILKIDDKWVFVDDGDKDQFYLGGNDGKTDNIFALAGRELFLGYCYDDFLSYMADGLDEAAGDID